MNIITQKFVISNLTEVLLKVFLKIAKPFYEIQWYGHFVLHSYTVLRHLSQRKARKPSRKGLALDGAKKKCYTAINATNIINCS